MDLTKGPPNNPYEPGTPCHALFTMMTGDASSAARLEREATHKLQESETLKKNAVGYCDALELLDPDFKVPDGIK